MNPKSTRQSAGASDRRAALLAGYLGWTLDAFDFFLVVFCVTAIGREFHKTDAEIMLSLTATLALRPVGAFVFGLLADRYGRRMPLVLALVFYSIMEVLSGLAPNYATFIVLRALFGIGMGGEWGVGASLVMEKAPTKSRGLLSGFLQEGYATGYLLAAVCYFFVFPRVGWRPLFFIGGAPALLAIFVFSHVRESEVWERGKRQSWGELGRAITANWKLFIYMAFLMMGMNLVSHGTQDMYPTFLERQWGFKPEPRAVMTGISMIGAIVGGLLFGGLSDRLGRRRTMITALLAGIAVIPLWAFAPTASLLGIGAFLMQFMVQGAWGVVPAHLAELAPDNVRGFLPGFGYQVGVLLASTVGYLEATLAKQTSYAIAMAGTAAIVMLIAIIGTAIGKERGGAAFGSE